MILLMVLFPVLKVAAQTYEYGKLRCSDGDTLLYRYLTPEKSDISFISTNLSLHK